VAADFLRPAVEPSSWVLASRMSAASCLPHFLKSIGQDLYETSPHDRFSHGLHLPSQRKMGMRPCQDASPTSVKETSHAQA